MMIMMMLKLSMVVLFGFPFTKLQETVSRLHMDYERQVAKQVADRSKYEELLMKSKSF